MSRPFLGFGARGEVVEELQQCLCAAGHDTHGVDGAYGRDTVAAVTAFQREKGMPANGLAGDATWTAATGKPLAELERRCLALTAAIEGHGYSLALGNWDNAWLTWGIIGFTLKHGEVQKIINEIRTTLSDALSAAFGEAAHELIAVVNASRAEQERWANSVTVGSQVRQPWRKGFAYLGTLPEVRDIQRSIARRDYFEPAVATARRLGLKSELGLALCFDIHVQNGGIKKDAQRALSLAAGLGGERELRILIAHTVAGSAKAAYREDVRSRKLAIATGRGVVHGMNLVLENWGVGEYADPLLN